MTFLSGVQESYIENNLIGLKPNIYPGRYRGFLPEYQEALLNHSSSHSKNSLLHQIFGFMPTFAQLLQGVLLWSGA
jgi:hypothetical protein